MSEPRNLCSVVRYVFSLMLHLAQIYFVFGRKIKMSTQMKLNLVYIIVFLGTNISPSMIAISKWCRKFDFLYLRCKSHRLWLPWSFMQLMWLRQRHWLLRFVEYSFVPGTRTDWLSRNFNWSLTPRSDSQQNLWNLIGKPYIMSKC